MFHAYPQYEELLAQTQLVLFMLGMGATLEGRDFLAIFQRPWSFLTGFLCQVIAFPWLAVALNHLLGLEPGLAIGMILVSTMPGGALSKMFSYLGHGNVALSISLSVASHLASLVAVPVYLQLLASHYLRDEFEMPTLKIVRDVTVFMLIPMFGGMFLARVWPDHRMMLSKLLVRFGLVVVLFMVVGSLGSGRISPGSEGWRAPLAIILFCFLGQQISAIPFYIFRWPRGDRMAVGIEVTMRNMNLALLLYSTLIPDNSEITRGMLFVIFFYAGAAMVTGVLLTLNHRRLDRNDRLRAQRAASTPPTQAVSARD